MKNSRPLGKAGFIVAMISLSLRWVSAGSQDDDLESDVRSRLLKGVSGAYGTSRPPAQRFTGSLTEGEQQRAHDWSGWKDRLVAGGGVFRVQERDVLTQEQCQQLITFAKEGLGPMKTLTTGPPGEKKVVSEQWIRSQIAVNPDHPSISPMMNKLGQCLPDHVDFSENCDIVIGRYEESQKQSWHCDVPGDYSILLYLNDDFKGGCTMFRGQMDSEFSKNEQVLVLRSSDWHEATIVRRDQKGGYSVLRSDGKCEVVETGKITKRSSLRYLRASGGSAIKFNTTINGKLDDLMTLHAGETVSSGEKWICLVTARITKKPTSSCCRSLVRKIRSLCGRNDRR